jgi:iron complex outermembrane receptor protein
MKIKRNSKRIISRTLPLLLTTTVSTALHAQTISAPTTLQTVTVTGQAPLDNATPPPYAGGLVASGGQAGILGNLDYMDMPFSQTSYTSTLIDDQQARTLGDVLAVDPSVQTGNGYGNQAETFVIRGLPLYNDDLSFNGLYGILPRQVLPTEMIERVEVFKGASAFLNGAAPGGSGLGGLINIQPKRAQDDPLTRLNLDYTSTGQFGEGVDIGRRWGEDNQYGIRLNAAKRDGDGGVTDADTHTTLGTLGLDYRGDRLRASLDLGYQRVRFDRPRPTVYLEGPVPAVPDNRLNYGQPWTYSNLESTFGVARVEYDLTRRWTAYAAFGMSRDKEYGIYSSPTINGDGTGTAGLLGVAAQRDSATGETGLRGRFETGAIGHRINLAYSVLNTTTRNAWETGSVATPVSLYESGWAARPAGSLYGDMDDPAVARRTQLRSLALSDTLSLLRGDVLLTLGGRNQEIIDHAYDVASTQQTSRYDESTVTPVVGLVVRPWDTVSVYANYIEGLTQGDIAPLDHDVNPGAVLAPYHTKQIEAGIKVDLDTLGGSLGVFQLRKPEAYTNAAGVYGAYGEQRNRGVELSVYGQPLTGWRVMGGITLMQPTLRHTSDGTDDGNDAAGVSRVIATLGTEWDVASVKGLTLQTNLRYQGRQYTSASNDYQIPGWTRIDVGASYQTRISGHSVRLRAGVDNLADRRYWATVGGMATNGYLTQGAGRTYKVSVSTDF